LFLYSAYGLVIRSEFPLPALLPGEGPADVHVRRAALEEVTVALRADPDNRKVTPEQGQVLWDGYATFLARHGTEILVDPVPGVDERTVQLGVLGPSFAMLLQQRGFLLLHASAVAVDGAAVAFLGPPRHGKSTTAAALHAQGYPLVVDDVVAIRFDGGGATVYPAFPQFKLWPDSVRALGHDPDTLPEIEPDYVKRARPVDAGFWGQEALPLRCIYVLAWGDALAIEPVAVREAFLQIASHSYAIHWMHEVSGSTYLHARARLAEQVPVRRLRRPRDFALLPEVLAQVLEDVASLPRDHVASSA
jgi:hypothetical protein